jgi:hypothetical protein
MIQKEIKIPPEQYSKIMIGCGPSIETPNI